MTRAPAAAPLCLGLLLSALLVTVVRADAVAFNVNTTFATLHYAYAAFCPEAQLSDWNCSWCRPDDGFRFERMLTDAGTGAYGYVGYTPDTIYISFRGTQGWKNVLDDLEFIATDDYPDIPGARVHAGFLRAYRSVQKQLRGALTDILERCPGCTRVICTGHSLGAALSGLAAVDVAVLANSSLSLAGRNLVRPCPL